MTVPAAGLVAAVTLQPATAVPVPALTATGKVLAYSRRCRLLGWSIAQGAAAGLVTISDGRTGDGATVGLSAPAANAVDTTWLGTTGVLCERGVAVSSKVATLASVVYVLDLG